MINRKELYQLFRQQKETEIQLRNGNTYFITDGVLKDLLLLDIANSLEQIPYINMSKNELEKEKVFYL